MDVLVYPKFHADNREEALRKLVDFTFTKGYVKETYLDAVLEREKVFPTGLIIKGACLRSRSIREASRISIHG